MLTKKLAVRIKTNSFSQIHPRQTTNSLDYLQEQKENGTLLKINI